MKKEKQKSSLDNYELIKKLKKGTTGRVSLYRSKINQQLVAIKKIDISDFPIKNKNNLASELQILKMVNHPNIVKYYDSFEEKNNLYICMEYCENNDLNNYIIILIKIKKYQKVLFGK